MLPSNNNVNNSSYGSDVLTYLDSDIFKSIVS